MAQAGINVQLSVKEIYERACPKCKAAIRALILDKISEQMVDQILGVPQEASKHEG